MRIFILSIGAFFITDLAWAEQPTEFDQSSFGSFSYEGISLVEPKITGVSAQGVIVTDKEGKNSVIVPLDRAIKRPELRMRAKDAIEALLKNADNNEPDVKSDPTMKVGELASKPTSTTSAAKQLRKTERMQMEQAVWIAGLVHHRYDARHLTDAELIDLHQKARPILELQMLRGEVNALRNSR